jgi:hypothetical protein
MLSRDVVHQSDEPDARAPLSLDDVILDEYSIEYKYIEINAYFIEIHALCSPIPLASLSLLAEPGSEYF